MNLTLCSPQLFDRQAGPVLRRQEVEYSLMLGIARQLLEDPSRYPGDNLQLTVMQDDRLLLAAVRTPPHKLLLYTDGDQPEAMRLLAAWLLRHSPSIPGVLALDNVAADWARLWRELTGATATLMQSIRLHVLEQVTDAAHPTGHARWATQGDAPLLREWIVAFHEQAVPHSPPPAPDRLLERNIGHDRLMVWEDGGETVSMAMLTRPTGNCLGVGLVYTPASLRRHSYATALVAELSRRGLAQGYRYCSLYTDLANPISNSIYRKIGYRPVSDWSDYFFSYATSEETHAE